MEKLNKSEKILVSLCVLLLVGFFYFKFFLSPIIHQVSSAYDSVTNLKAQMENINKTKVSNEKDAKELEKLRISYNDAISALPSTEKNPEVAHLLKALALQAGVDIQSVGLSDGAKVEIKDASNNNSNSQGNAASNKKDSGKLMAISTQVTVKGAYSNIMVFIELIENNKRLAQVKTCGISNDAGGKLRGSITLDYFYSDGDRSNIKYDFMNGTYGKENLFY